MYQSNIYQYLEELTLRHPSTSSGNSQGTVAEPVEAKLLICKDDKEVVQIRDVANLLGFDTFVLPDLRVGAGEDLRAYDEDVQALLMTLAKYDASKEKKVLISPLRTLLIPFPKPEYFAQQTIEFGDTLNLTELKDTLYHWGYHFTDIAAQRGEVSFRGDIIDIFPIDADKPYRVSMFDEEVETIQHYDDNTQKRESEELESLSFTPAFLALDKTQYEALKNRTERSSYDTFVKDIDSLGLWHLDDLGQSALEQFSGVLASDLDEELKEIYELTEPLVPRKSFLLPVVPEGSKYRDLEAINPNKLLESHKDKKITILAKNESIVRGSELDSFENIEFVYQDGIVNIMGGDRLILSLNKPIKRKRVKKASIILDELKPEDYVVHENYGVGIFKGIEKREILGSLSEFVVMHYQNEDALLIPVSSLEVIDRYVAEGGSLPILDRMGKASFKKLKAKVKEKLFAIASQIINLSAQRHLKKGIKLKRNMEEHAIFMSEAGFVHTEDQEKAIDDMLNDMSSGKMMDRLLSADVGFGKTEVAMNGMFVAVKMVTKR